MVLAIFFLTYLGMVRDPQHLKHAVGDDSAASSVAVDCRVWVWAAGCGLRVAGLASCLPLIGVLNQIKDIQIPIPTGLPTLLLCGSHSVDDARQNRKKKSPTAEGRFLRSLLWIIVLMVPNQRLHVN